MYNDELVNNTRITVISSDGTVLADSRPLNIDAVENHLHRPEIQAAANDSLATYVRYSDTLGIDLIYYALKVNRAGSYVFIRAATPVAEINEYLFQSLLLFGVILLTVSLLCFAFERGIINRITKPFTSVEQKLRMLSSGVYTSEPTARSYEEIDEISLVLQSSFDSLCDEKNKLDYILNNISDGIFAVDENKNIALIINSALDIFDVTPDISNKNIQYLISGKTFVGTVENCINSTNNVLFEIELQGNTYIVTIKQLPDTKLTMTVLTNITENRENDKRREEFFANASHELKTPFNRNQRI